MLPTKPLSEMTEAEILEAIRAIRIKRVADSSRPRPVKPGRKRSASDQALDNLLDQLEASLNKDNNNAAS